MGWVTEDKPISPTSPGRTPAGLRGRIKPPTPPAPVPAARAAKRVGDDALAARELLATAGARPKTPVPPATDMEPAGSVDESTSDREVVRTGGSIAVATMVSRLTGFLRNWSIGATLGPVVGSAFNTASTLPNLITEIVLGAVLTSLVVPVLVRAEKEDPDHGEAFVRRLFTLALSLLVVVTTLAVVGAPLLIRLSLGSDGLVNVKQSTSFATLLLPAILFYGMFSLFMAVLNTKGVFKPGAWAPVCNNLVQLAVMGLYWLTPGRLDPAEQAGITDPHVMLLGLGVTFGVATQCLIMVPYLRREGVNLKPLWGIDQRLKEFGGMAMAIIVYVAISQAGYIITTRIASASDARGPIIYQQTWLLLQVPYGIIGVTLLTAIMPRLSRHAADGDDKAVVGDLTMAAKLTFLALLPIIVFLTAFGTQIATALFAYGAFDAESAKILGWTLSFSAFTLIPYAIVLLHLRVFYAREEAWTPTFIIAGIIVTKVALSYAAVGIASRPELVVVLLGAANGFGFISGAMIGGVLLRRKLGSLGMRDVLRTSGWAGGAAVVAAAVALLLDRLVDRVAPDLFSAMGSLGYLVRVAVAGVLFVALTAVLLSRSGLPEVASFQRALARIPKVGRFFAPRGEEDPQVAAAEAERPSLQELSSQMLSAEPFDASPAPPPMSAGFVRPPRLVAGAPIANGKFRLLAPHGQVPGAKFWQAREMSTGRQVAMVFVDTSSLQPVPGAPAQPVTAAKAAGSAAEVARRTRKVASLAAAGIPGIAQNIRLFTYRAGCLVVSDWVPGSPLRDVEQADPFAASLAVSTLASAVAAGQMAGQPLGLQVTEQIRINTEGQAVYAFPVVLPGASKTCDVSGMAAALNFLIGHNAADGKTAAAQAKQAALAAPDDKDAEAAAQRAQEHAAELAEVAALREEITQAAEDPTGFDASSFARRLHDVGVKGTAPIEVEKDSAPKPKETSGFGGRGYTGRMKALIAALFVVVAVVLAFVASTLFGAVQGDQPDSPLKKDSVENVVPSMSSSVEGVVETR